MLLSIIIPVFNGESKIGRCLDSLLLLKEQDIEFIIVNDGSIDNTLNICEDYARKEGRIRLINQENAGVSKARNTGIEVATGEFIAFADADDELTESYDEIIDALKNTDSDFFAFEHYVLNRKETNRIKRVLLKPGKNEKRSLYNNFLTGTSCCVWNNIYRTEIIQKHKISFPSEMSMGEDCVFNARYLRHCENAYYIPKVGYKYYEDNTGSASNKGKISYLKDFVKIYDNYLQIYNSHDNLEFSFYSAYYIDKVYLILRENRTKMTREEKSAFRKTDFYHEIMKHRYKYWMREIRKWLIRVYIYVG